MIHNEPSIGGAEALDKLHGNLDKLADRESRQLGLRGTVDNLLARMADLESYIVEHPDDPEVESAIRALGAEVDRLTQRYGKSH
ncbi:hypothetical protein A3I40_01855 [Candidatus Uhrbacteria bacterium RIFCSPLOWO2_02_FULL_48_12]|uniref:Uncharacterized protein n=1 Tax=Candidatus Uhrbacteria bacterium RIFCSPLOWO2_02_FULL_48_12 TaxID=1802407 RepID=A0A1F7V6N1_9BACT|nr:MAG: hypothetical protein A3I40_01855 [Candidatus Uhrbacteria bacterium RIFCSPLOWO2_02_FULL_48_12]